MNNKNMIVALVFMVGLVFCGVGSGISFLEFSSFSYGQEFVLPENNSANLTKEKQYYDIEIKEGYKTNLHSYYSDNINITLDKNVPFGQICSEITYDKDISKPNLVVEPYTIREDSTDIDQYIYMQYSYTNDFKLFMQIKDKMLSDLKNKKISSYEINYINDINISINPETMKYVEISSVY